MLQKDLANLKQQYELSLQLMKSSISLNEHRIKAFEKFAQ
jgi:hypothetical protein